MSNKTSALIELDMTANGVRLGKALTRMIDTRVWMTFGNNQEARIL